MEDTMQTLPNNEYMLKKEITLKEALNFYQNTWTRYLASRLIDVEHDRIKASIDPEEIVTHGDKDQYGRYFEEAMPVRHRLEKRKMLVENALLILQAVGSLIKTPDGDFEAKHLSAEALRVSDAVMREMAGLPAEEPAPAQPEASDVAVAATEEKPSEVITPERVETETNNEAAK